VNVVKSVKSRESNLVLNVLMSLVETISLDKQFQISITWYAKLYFRTLRLHSGLLVILIIYCS